MQITPVNIRNSSVSFGTRREDIRKAQDIERRAKLVFPMMSWTMVNEKYLSLNSKSNSCRRPKQLLGKLSKKITRARENAEFYEQILKENPNIKYVEAKALKELEVIKDLKVGNCHENAVAALAVLAANQYYDCSQVSLGCKVTIRNRDTKSVEDKYYYELDHTFVVADINGDGKKDVVIDPWLDFADSKSGSMARFKAFYTKKLEEKKDRALSSFLSDAGKDKYRYEASVTPEILELDGYSWKPNDLRQLGKMVRENYQETVLKEKE